MTKKITTGASTKLTLGDAIKAHLAAMEEKMAKMVHPYEIAYPEGSFPACQLSTWLDIAQRAGVSYVPGEVVADIPVGSMLGFERDDNLQIQGDLKPLLTINRNLKGQMLRWDCCSGSGLKWHMDNHGQGSDGKVPPPDTFEMHPGDPRIFEILLDYQSPTVKVLRRPWITARMHEKYPVEFRVYVRDGEITAVSNYYPQRALPETWEMCRYTDEAKIMTEKLLGVIRQEDLLPLNPRQPIDSKDIRFTADFMVTEEGDLLFLEAGPGYGHGAHPCCFYNPVSHDVAPLQGVRLKVFTKDEKQ